MSAHTFDIPLDSHTRHTGHGNRHGARRHAPLNPATDTRPAAIELAAKERRAVELRLQDKTFAQIADELGFKSRAAARTCVIRGLQRWYAPAEVLREMELLRLDALAQRLWPLIESAAVDDRLKAIGVYLKISHQRALITGMYNCKAPSYAEQRIAVRRATVQGPTVEEIERLMELTGQIREENAGRTAQADVVEATSQFDDYSDDYVENDD